MDHNIKPSQVMNPKVPSFNRLAMLASSRITPREDPLRFIPREEPMHVSPMDSPVRPRPIPPASSMLTIDHFLEGYISASIEKGHNYTEILNKCAEKGYAVSRQTLNHFMIAFKSTANDCRNDSLNRKIRESQAKKKRQRKQRESISTETSDSTEKSAGSFEILSRGVITILNLLFFLVSAILIAFGCMIKYGSANLLRNLEPIFDSMQGISEQKHYPLGTISITHLILEAATIAIILGSIMLAISFFGWCGACCKRRTMLVLYCALLTFILALQVTVVIMLGFMRSRVDLALKKPLQDTLIHQYKGIQGQDTLTVSWNYIMNSLKCCGVDGYDDFDKSRNWDRIYHDPHTMKSVHLSIPLICCKYLGDYPNVQPPKNFTCAIAPDRWNSNYKTGCYSEIWDFISEAELMLAGIMMVATIIQMMLIFAAVYLISKRHYPDDDDYSE